MTAKACQHRRQDDGRSSHEDRTVGERGCPVFLAEQLEGVGQHLHLPKDPHPVGTVAVLELSQQAALHQDQPAGDEQRQEKHDHDLDDVPGSLRHRGPPRAAGRRSRVPLPATRAPARARRAHGARGALPADSGVEGRFHSLQPWKPGRYRGDAERQAGDHADGQVEARPPSVDDGRVSVARAPTRRRPPGPGR